MEIGLKICVKKCPECDHSGPAALDFYERKQRCKKCIRERVRLGMRKLCGPPNPEFTGRHGRGKIRAICY